MARTLWDALGDIDDKRGRKGRQYALRSVLGIAIAAMLAGANDPIASFRWGGRRLKSEALAVRDRERQSYLPRSLSLFLSSP